MSMCFIPPYTPLLYIKTGVYSGIHYFLIFALKHILWVHVILRFKRVPTIYVLEQKYENCQTNQLKIIFTAVKNRCILHGRVFVMMKGMTRNCYNRNPKPVLKQKRIVILHREHTI